MKLLSWLRFEWDLRNLDFGPVELARHYSIRRAIREEEGVVRKTIQSAFLLDADWSDVLKRIWHGIDEDISKAFDSRDAQCLVLTHGSRIIGASIVSPIPTDMLHLLSGPCILVEYRNRGFGTALLAASLRHLAAAGMDTAAGMTRKSMPAGKFVYPKFGSRFSPASPELEMASF
ncbi:MAG TPA: GNAT family N-acetyltransferase [Chthoniobacterales bacterium]